MVDYHGNPLNTQTKYDCVCAMRSIGSFTKGEHPSLTGFRLAIMQNRVCGDYWEKIVIVSNDPNEQYTFIYEGDSNE